MALFKKPGRNVWLYQVKIDGKSWCRSTGETDRRRAEAKVPDLRKLVLLHRDAPRGSLRLGNAIVREVARLETDVSPYQAERVGRALRNFLKWIGDVPLEHVTEEVVEKYQRKRLKEAARSTVEKEVCYLCRLLRENRFPVRRPKAKPGRCTPNRAFTPEELAKVFQHATDRYRLLYAFLLATGARIAEIAYSGRSAHKPVLKSEVDLEHRVVLVRSAKGRSGEPAKTRRLAIPEALVEPLREQMRNTEGPYVFERVHKCARDFDSTLRRAEIPKLDPLGRKLTIHSFRHTFATLMAECIGHNPFFLKEILGHKRITTTQQYCNPTAPVLALPFDLESLRGGRKGWTQKKKRLLAEA